MGVFDYDIAIVGGGLAGLTMAIQLRKRGFSVVVFEKNTYPFHRVCGEYISFESWDYLIDCGIDLPTMNLPQIRKLELSSVGGRSVKTDLDLGGFGISRYTIDYLLYARARELGVSVYDGCKVGGITHLDTGYTVTSSIGDCHSRIAIGSFGKRSNIDVQWERNFITRKPSALNNYVGIKHHIRTAFPADTIALHNFENGYCGLSTVEEDKVCLCYLTTSANLQRYGGIADMEQKQLRQNPHLKMLFDNSDFLFTQPLSISQISFDTKEPVHRGVPLIGDACGMITPLCGNGMSMAMHSGKILVELVTNHLADRLALSVMLATYQHEWQNAFRSRLRTGRFVQNYFGKSWQTNLFVSLMGTFPSVGRSIIRHTHGVRF